MSAHRLLTISRSTGIPYVIPYPEQKVKLEECFTSLVAAIVEQVDTMTVESAHMFVDDKGIIGVRADIVITT